MLERESYPTSCNSTICAAVLGASDLRRTMLSQVIARSYVECSNLAGEEMIPR